MNIKHYISQWIRARQFQEIPGKGTAGTIPFFLEPPGFTMDTSVFNINNFFVILEFDDSNCMKKPNWIFIL